MKSTYAFIQRCTICYQLPAYGYVASIFHPFTRATPVLISTWPIGRCVDTPRLPLLMLITDYPCILRRNSIHSHQQCLQGRKGQKETTCCFFYIFTRFLHKIRHYVFIIGNPGGHIWSRRTFLKFQIPGRCRSISRPNCFNEAVDISLPFFIRRSIGRCLIIFNELHIFFQ